MVLCLGGAVATLSRGGALGIAVGVLMFAFLRFRSSREGRPRQRASLAWAGFLVALVLLGAGAFGTDRLIERFHSSSVTADVRLQVWRDSFRVLANHPFGIGRGAFDRVYPIYRTVQTPVLSFRFAYVENEALQLLIDSGWLLFAGFVAVLALVVWLMVRHGRRDGVEAALVAALFAVAVHNLVDFGLETSGVLLPFMVVAATVLGRIHAGRPEAATWRSWPIVGIATLGLGVGIAAMAHPSYDNFDALLKKASSFEARREVLQRARRAHPLDYYYDLTGAQYEPIKASPGIPSPRFHLLNRALVLCPKCEAVHVEVARSLWTLGRRSQALLEWRTALSLRPQLLNGALGELFSSGASPAQLASIATFEPARLVDVAAFLSSIARPAAALTVLSQAEAVGAPRAEVLLVRGKLQLDLGQTQDAAQTLAQLRAMGLRDVRLVLLETRLLLATKGADGADAALALLDGAAAQYPLDVDVQHARIDLVTSYGKWQATDRALEGFKEALYRSRGSANEAHLAGARIYSRLSRWTKALDEYQIALADGSSDVSLWLEYGHAAEAAGRNAAAREAYSQAARLSPRDPQVTQVLKELDDRQARLRAQINDLTNR
jgi:tetratricopeptide (TPR) repeat protein